MIANAMKAATFELPTRPLKPGFGVEVLKFDFPTASQDELLAFDAIQRSHPIVAGELERLSKVKRK